MQNKIAAVALSVLTLLSVPCVKSKPTDSSNRSHHGHHALTPYARVSPAQTNSQSQDSFNIPIKWRIKPAVSVVMSFQPTIAKGVIFWTDSFDVYAANYSSGRVLWKFSSPDARFFGTPAVANDTVYAIGTGNCLYALNCQTGKLKWKLPFGDLPLEPFPTISGGVLYVGCAALVTAAGTRKDGTTPKQFVYAVDVDKRKVLWATEAASGDLASPLVVNGIVYWPGFGGLMAIDAKTGHVLWHLPSLIAQERLKTWNNIIYCTTFRGGERQSIHALEARTGKQLWLLVSEEYASVGICTVTAGAVYLDSTNCLYALDPKTGLEQWKFKTAKHQVNEPLIAGSLVIFCNGDKGIYAVDRNTGTMRWYCPLHLNSDVPLSAAAGLLFAFTADDELIAVEIAAIERYYKQNRSTITAYKRAIEVIEQCDDLTRAMRYRKAVDILSKEISYSPQLVPLYLKRAEIYHNLGQCKKEIDDLSKAMSLSPRNLSLYFKRGLAYYIEGQHQQAVNDFTKLISLDPRNLHPEGPGPSAYYYRGNAYSKLGQYQKALEDYIKDNNSYTKASRGANSASFYKNCGLCYNGLEQFQKAIENFNKAIKLYPATDKFSNCPPGDAVAYAGRELAYCKLGQCQKAIDDYTKSIRLEPQGMEVYIKRAAAYSKLGQQQQAIDDYSQVIRLCNLPAQYTYFYPQYTTSYWNSKEVKDKEKQLGEVYKCRAKAYEKIDKHDAAENDRQSAKELHDALEQLRKGNQPRP